ncbi:unnamed protein product [Nesidiocoris tenuis]|uniref:Uncharacterized protein n=1 Tax=Nesidiocoris tenuis TaxID=355587 RepID=A0A6H5GN74_9HEMI|nr:unnamed protein product [Nesidiocoris tenuis]
MNDLWKLHRKKSEMENMNGQIGDVVPRNHNSNFSGTIFSKTETLGGGHDCHVSNDQFVNMNLTRSFQKRAFSNG